MGSKEPVYLFLMSPVLAARPGQRDGDAVDRCSILEEEVFYRACGNSLGALQTSFLYFEGATHALPTGSPPIQSLSLPLFPLAWQTA